MYSTIPKDKIDKHVIDFIYKLFVLLITILDSHPMEHNLIGCRVEHPSLAGAQSNVEKEPCGYGTVHAKMHTLTGMHTHTYCT